MDQRFVVDLPNPRFWKFPPEFDLARARPFDHLLTTVLDEFLLGAGILPRAVLQHNKGLYAFTADPIGYAHHASLSH